MEWVAALQQDVVRGVDHVVDGTGSRRPQAGLEPLGGGAHLHASDDHPHEPEAQVRVFNTDRHTGGGDLLLVADESDLGQTAPGDVRQSNRRRPTRMQLTSDAYMGENVPSVGRHFHVQHGVVQCERLDDGSPHRGVEVELHDARSVLTQLELGLGAQHPLAVHTPDLSPTDLESAGELRPDRSEGIQGALLDDRGAAHHLDLSVRAFDPAQGKAVGVGVGARLEDPCHNHVTQLTAGIDHTLHGETTQREPLLNRVEVQIQARSHVSQPLEGNVHDAISLSLENCRRNLMSFS